MMYLHRRFGLKRSVYFFVLVLFFAFSLFPGIGQADLEAQLSKTTGQERIPLLLELTKICRVENPNKAIIYGQEALELLNRFPGNDIHASILNNIGHSYMVLGDLKKAKEYALKSLALAKQYNYKTGVGPALNTLGNICMIKSEFDRALEYYSRCVAIYNELKDQNRLAQANNSIACVYWEKADYLNSLKYFSNALKIYEKINNKQGISNANTNIGSIFWALKNWDRSLEHYRKSLEVFEELNDKQGIATSHNNIGLVYYEQHKYREALEEFAKARKIMDVSPSEPLHSNILYNTGCAYKELDNNQQALLFFNEAFNIREKTGNKKGISGVLIKIAAIDRQMGRYKEAIQKASQALQLAEEIKVKLRIRDAYQVLAETYEAMKSPQTALDYYKKFKETNDEIFNDETSKQITDLETNFEIERKQRQYDLLKKDQEKQRNFLYFVVLIAVLIAVLAFVIYTRYRLKARVTRILEKEIEERVLTEEKLRESEEKFRVLAEKSLVGIWIIQDHIIKYANPRSAKIFRYPPEQMMGKNPLDFTIEEDRALVSQNLEKRRSGSGNTFSYEFRGISRDGEILNLESYGSLTLYQGNPAILETIIDITRRKKAESELFKSRKMETVGILAGGIAHDFNNLLAVIVGNISMLKLSFGEFNPKITNFLENVEKASSQAADLSQKFITFSEGGWIMRKKVGLSDILTEMAQLSPEVKNIFYDISVPRGLHPISGDERQLRQVLTNLLLNAYEATSDNNRQITLHAQNISFDGDNPFSLEAGKYVQISVIDNGKGIPTDLLEKIFDPYFSTKTTVSQKGLGLGLAICYSIVKKHGGHINITSEVQRGTTVDLYLPVYND